MFFANAIWLEAIIDDKVTNRILTSIGALTILGVIVLQGHLDRITAREPSLDLLYLPHKNVIHALALGDDATGADVLWLRGVFYIAANSVEEKQSEYYSDLKTKATPSNVGSVQKSYTENDFRTDPRLKSMFFWNVNGTEAPQLLNLVERVTDLNPTFVTPYVYAATSLAMFYGRYDEARAIIDKGVRNCPNDWEPIYHRGFLRLFYENDKIGAADDIRHAALLSGAPIIVVQLAAALEVGAGKRDVALDFLRSLREITTDEVLKRKIDDMLNVYGKGIVIERAIKKTQINDMLNSMLAQDSL